MNSFQRLWWIQAQSDLDLFGLLRRQGKRQCHTLHYLQVATEKLSKAYFWRSGHAPPKTHTGFVRFLRALLSRPTKDLERAAKHLGFGRADDLDHWVRGILTLAYSLQNLAPAEAQDGPNPEYPWPHANPAYAPANYEFSLWVELRDTGRGRKLIEFIDRAIRRFESYA